MYIIILFFFCSKSKNHFKCNKRHEFTCPEIERNNVCNIKNCIYCNAKRRKELQLEKKSENKVNANPVLKNDIASTEEKEDDVKEITSSKRYFIEPPCNNSMDQMDVENVVEVSNENSNTNVESSNDTQEVVEMIKKSRPKLGTLPSYIPL